jgi:hypothetical protein
MRLHVHGVGRIALGADEPFGPDADRCLGRLAEVPIKQHAAPAAYRRYGRVTRLMVVAAARAVADAGLADASSLAVVTGTALGEVATSLELLERLHGSGGAAVGPALVPGSVHNAPAGHLTIALKTHAPSLAVSHGALSGEATLCAAADLLASGAADLALAVCADEADPAWVGRLMALGAGELSAALAAEAFQEGAVALVVGREPGGRGLGTVAPALERTPSLERSGALAVALGDGSVTPGAVWCARPGAGGADLAARLAAILGRPVECRNPAGGAPQAGALAALAEALIDGPPAGEIVFVGRELDDLGVVRLRP